MQNKKTSFVDTKKTLINNGHVKVQKVYFNDNLMPQKDQSIVLIKINGSRLLKINTLQCTYCVVQ